MGKKIYQHKLAVMGDSMAQGFNNGGIYRTDLSFPSLLTLGFEKPVQFDLPSFTAQAGIPINLEVLVRGLADKFGDSITLRDYLPAGLYLYKTLRRIKKYWEGNIVDLRHERPTPYHNQAVWGFAANDAWLMTDNMCKEFLENNRPHYSVFDVLPDHAMYITGRLVLNPGFNPDFRDHNQLENIQFLHQNGGIENLILCIGHNNFVGALSALDIIYSEPEDLELPHFKRKRTVYRPEHFESEMDYLFEKVARMKIKRVFVPTYPYITIPPITRGINEDKKRKRNGYFDYYTRFWIWDEDFDPEKHSHLTKDQAIELDQLVDQYNEIIRRLADKYEFHVVPVHRHVHAVARRRLGMDAIRPFPVEFIRALKKNEMTSHLVTENGRVKLSTDYIRVCEKTGKIMKGGIFSLDGLHPTTIGYGLITNIYRMSMEKAGVDFQKPIDWDFIIKQDTLVSNPPSLLSELRLLLQFLSLGHQERITKFGTGVLQQFMELFSKGKKLE